MKTKVVGLLAVGLLVFAAFASVASAQMMGVGKSMGPAMKEQNAVKYTGGAFKPDYCGRLNVKVQLFGCGGTPEPRFVRLCAAYAAHMTRVGCGMMSAPAAAATQ